MKIIINEKEKRIYDSFIFDKINDKLDNYLLKIHNEYKEFFDDDRIYIYNNLYADEDDYDLFKKDYESYIKNNYKKMLYKNEEKFSYNITLNNSNILLSNFVANGTLVLIIKRKIDYNTDINKRMEDLDNINLLTDNIDKELENILGVPVRIMFDDTEIPPKRFQNKKD